MGPDWDRARLSVIWIGPAWAGLSAIKIRIVAMGYYVGLDVSLKETSICVMDGDGKILCEGTVVTETRRALMGRRVVRGREAECHLCYAAA